MFDNIWVYFPTFSPYISLRYPKLIWVYSVYTWMAWLRQIHVSRVLSHSLTSKVSWWPKRAGPVDATFSFVRMAKILNLSIGSFMFVHVYAIIFGWNIRWFSRMDNDGLISFSIHYPFKASFGLPKRWTIVWQHKFEVVVEQSCLVIYSYLPWNLGVSWSDLTNGWRPNQELSVSLDCYSYSMELCGNRANDNLRKLINVSTMMFWKKYDDFWWFLATLAFFSGTQTPWSNRFLPHDSWFTQNWFPDVVINSLRLLGRRRWRPAERLRSWEV